MICSNPILPLDNDADLKDFKGDLTPVRPSHTPTDSYRFLLPPNFLNLREVNTKLEDYTNLSSDSADSDGGYPSLDADAIRVQLQEHHDFFKEYCGSDQPFIVSTDLHRSHPQSHSPVLPAFSLKHDTLSKSPAAILLEADHLAPDELALPRASIQPINMSVSNVRQPHDPSEWEAREFRQMPETLFGQAQGEHQQKGPVRDKSTLSKTENHIKIAKVSKSQAKVNKGYAVKTGRVKKRWKSENN
ncbi:hypothetical protein MMC24_003247 [Lignoscripta atroalba]|nr:hypothetical protein [Lignoscripta atroalba]